MKMVVFFVLVLLVSGFFLIFFFNKKSKKQSEYELEKPVFQQYLSKNLKEISGISYYADNQVLCVNDEIGKLFIYDFKKEEITDTLDFSSDGDYEAIEYINGIAYVMESNGLITAFNIENNTKETIDCRLPTVKEYEGLGFDKTTNSLLLAAKEMEGRKAVFSYNLNSKKLNEKFRISKDDINKYGKDGKDFKPSGIAVHPFTNDIYILASVGKKIIVFDQNGIKKHQYNLDDDQFPQPEGICFTPSADLIIASEGKNHLASISYFKYSSKNI